MLLSIVLRLRDCLIPWFCRASELAHYYYSQTLLIIIIHRLTCQLFAGQRIYWRSSTYKDCTVESAAFDGSDRRHMAFYPTDQVDMSGLAVLGENVYIPHDSGVDGYISPSSPFLAFAVSFDPLSPPFIPNVFCFKRHATVISYILLLKTMLIGYFKNALLLIPVCS